MSLTRPPVGALIAASHVDQLVDVLQRMSGQSEAGKWFLFSGGYQNGWTVSQYMVSHSQGSTPVSVSIDTADQAPTQAANSPATQNLTSSGFVVDYSVQGLTNTSRAGGNFTINY